MSNTIDKLRSKLEDANLDQDFRSLLQEAVFLIERQQGASLDLQASFTRLQKRYSELEGQRLRGYSGVLVWHGNYRVQLVNDGFPDEKDLQPVLRLLDRAKAELQNLTENQNAQNHPKQD
jgi:hypothetical protein